MIRISLWIIVAVISVLLTLILVLKIPAVQTFIVSKVTHSIQKKTGTEISIGSIKIAFPKTVEINGIYFQGQNADTLLYLHSLRMNIDLFARDNFSRNSSRALPKTV